MKADYLWFTNGFYSCHQTRNIFTLNNKLYDMKISTYVCAILKQSVNHSSSDAGRLTSLKETAHSPE